MSPICSQNCPQVPALCHGSFLGFTYLMGCVWLNWKASLALARTVILTIGWDRLGLLFKASCPRSSVGCYQ